MEIKKLLNLFENKRDTGVVQSDVQQVTNSGYVGGYASKISAAQGETIDFHVSTNISGPYDLTIWHEGASRELKQTIPGLTGAQYSCAEGYMGCGWPVAASITIPHDWPSGTYTVDIPTLGTTERIIFWVREDDLGSTSRVLFVSAVNTYNAYTEYGGKSVYDFNSSYGFPASKVSFNRPFRNNGVGHYFQWDGKFPKWALAKGYDLEFAGESDLEFIPDLLSHYDVLVIGGHSEYWTWNMRDRVKTFIKNGGRLINLSGNTMWWQIRYEDNGRTMVAYKDYRDDPIKDPTLTTDYNWDYPILDSEYTITGAHFAKGGFAPSGNFSFENGYGGYWVQKADHWVFDNTNVQNDEIFGRTDSAVTAVIEHEVDGTTFNCDTDGSTILGPLANTGTPYNYTILAISPAIYGQTIGFANMGIYTVEGGGAVFSANTIGWATALGDPVVSQITQNVLDRFLSNDPLPQEDVASEDTRYLFYDRFNCNQLYDNGLTPVVPEWETIPNFNYYYSQYTDNTRFTNACGVDGSGLEISLNHDNTMLFQSQVKPNWGDTDMLFTRMNLNFSNMTMAEGNEFVLFQHNHDTRQGSKTLLAQIQIRWMDGAPHMRYKPGDWRYDPPWYPVPRNRPFLFETGWDNEADLISVWIDGERFDYPAILDEQLPINRVDTVLRSVDSSINGHICLDEYAFDSQRIGDFDVEQFEVDISAPLSKHAFPGETVTLNHQITNQGTSDEAFSVEVTNDLDWEVTVDPVMTSVLRPGEVTGVTITVQVPSSAAGHTVANVETTVTAVSEKSKDTVTDKITIDKYEVSLSETPEQNAMPGEKVTFMHRIENSGTLEEQFHVSVTGSKPWEITCHPEITEQLSPGESTQLEITVQVPQSASANTIANFDVTVTGSNEQSQASLTDVIMVNEVIALNVTEGLQKNAMPGQEIIFDHTITNLSNTSQTFSIAIQNDLPDWITTSNPSVIGPLAPGEQATFEVAVQVPDSVEGTEETLITVHIICQKDQETIATLVDMIHIEVYKLYLPLLITSN